MSPQKITRARASALLLFAAAVFSRGSKAWGQSTSMLDAFPDDVKALVDWIQRKGRSGTIDGVTTSVIGVSDGQRLPSVYRAFRNNDTQIVSALELVTVPRGRVIVMFQAKTGFGVVWLVSEDGRLLRTGELTFNSHSTVPNDKYYGLWVETKNVLLKHMHEED